MKIDKYPLEDFGFNILNREIIC